MVWVKTHRSLPLMRFFCPDQMRGQLPRLPVLVDILLMPLTLQLIPTRSLILELKYPSK